MSENVVKLKIDEDVYKDFINEAIKLRDIQIKKISFKYLKEKNKIKAEKEFGSALIKYLEEAKNGKITLKTLDCFIDSLKVRAYSEDFMSFPIYISTDKRIRFFRAIYTYTKELGEKNEIRSGVKSPKLSWTLGIPDLSLYLTEQKKILNGGKIIF